ncbi:MAG: DUF1256 domain-containing protein [Clostridia bacterium]|nr:DUF1256 domain-containing protein [Clostridia bacterium]
MNVFNVNNHNTNKRFSFAFCEALIEKNADEPIFLCVGNSNIVGDLFGPLCGELLKKQNPHLKVFGTLSSNITSKNLQNTYSFIKNTYPLNQVVIIDSALGEEEEVGLVKFLEYGCFPAHKSNNLLMGNLSVLGVVNAVGISNFMFLKSVKFNQVLKMANCCVQAILEGLKIKEIYKNLSNNLCKLNG